MQKRAQQSVHWTLGIPRHFRAFFLALRLSHFDGESTLPPTAANTDRFKLIDCFYCRVEIKSLSAWYR